MGKKKMDKKTEAEKKIEEAVRRDWEFVMGGSTAPSQIPTINTFVDYSIPTIVTNHTC